MPKRAEDFEDLVNRLAPAETWEDFAARAGVTSRRVLSFRRGEGIRPFRTTIAKLAAALGVSPADVTAAIAESVRRHG